MRPKLTLTILSTVFFMTAIAQRNFKPASINGNDHRTDIKVISYNDFQNKGSFIQARIGYRFAK